MTTNNPTPTQQGETLECPLCSKPLTNLTNGLAYCHNLKTDSLSVDDWKAHSCPLAQHCVQLPVAVWKALITRRAAVAGPRVDRALYSELIHIAAELARGTDFLSTCAEDMSPRLKRADILKTAERQELRLKDWANRVRQVADKLSAATSSPAPAEKLPLPTDYECIAPSEQVIVINLLRGICDADKQEVARLHLNLCFRCQELAGGVVPAESKGVAGEHESLIIEGNREEAIKLLRQLREAADPEEIQRQKESWAQLEAALNPTTKGDR